MHIYEAKKFNLPSLEGISDESVKQHIGLYEGYVKNFNGISALMADLMLDSEKNVHALSELQRRLSFEFGGMRLHEHYFAQWEGGAKGISSGAFADAVKKQFGSDDAKVTLEKLIKNIGNMRGPGWAILYYDKEAGVFQTGFSGEQHQGHFVTLPILLALDVWEHAFLLDYGAQGKGKYIDAFFKNLNWQVVENRFTAAKM